MADETTPDALPFPEPADDNDVPGVMEALAQRIQVVLVALRAAFVPNTRKIETAAGSALTGGGDLSADRTLAVDFASSGVSSSTKAVRANDSRLADARPPTAHTHGDFVGIVQPSGDLTRDPAASSSPADVPGLTKTFTVPDAVNDYMVTVELNVALHANNAPDQPTCIVTLVVDGSTQTSQVQVRIPIVGTVRIPVAKTWVVANLSAASHTIKVQVAATGSAALVGVSDVTVFADDSQMIIERAS